ncbi:Hsp90 cochaperone shq1, partial [Nowakowskiella sp. JEL0078]
LEFPHSVVENDSEETIYDISTGDMTVKIPKEKPGQFFENLDLLTTLLLKSKSNSSSANEVGSRNEEGKKLEKLLSGGGLIQVLNSNETPSTDQEVIYDWNSFEVEPEYISTSKGSNYGFNKQFSNLGAHIREVADNIVEIEELDKSTEISRREVRIRNENIKFDPDYYICDFHEDEEIKRLNGFKPFFWNLLKKQQEIGRGEIKNLQTPNVLFSDREQEIMRRLPNKECNILLDERSTYLGLVDLIFAYCYNHRITESDNTVESAWCIAKLSSTISCFDKFHTLRDVMISSIRRSLSYPLYRNFELVQKIVQDVTVIFKLGKRMILKCLLEIKDIFETNGDEYGTSIMNRSVLCKLPEKEKNSSDNVVRSIASELNHFKAEKSEVGWDLEALETENQNAEESGHELKEKIQGLRLEEAEKKPLIEEL